MKRLIERGRLHLKRAKGEVKMIAVKEQAVSCSGETIIGRSHPSLIFASRLKHLIGQ